MNKVCLPELEENYKIMGNPSSALLFFFSPVTYFLPPNPLHVTNTKLLEDVSCEAPATYLFLYGSVYVLIKMQKGFYVLTFWFSPIYSSSL